MYRERKRLFAYYQRVEFVFFLKLHPLASPLCCGWPPYCAVAKNNIDNIYVDVVVRAGEEEKCIGAGFASSKNEAGSR